MILYRKPERVVTRKPASGDLIGCGEIEAALLDQLCPERDELLDSPLPEPHFPIRVSVPEGYAYYGLDPATYAQSARRFTAEWRPAEVVCIGIRSIGTSLSAVVASELAARGVRVHRYSVRPHGHPFNRKLQIGPRLEQTWRSLGHAHFAIVDEGPGLSGSTLACVAEKIASLGVLDSRIVLFPSWMPDDRRFPRLLKYRHYCAKSQPEPGWKFEGFGIYGEMRFARAQRLAEPGYSPPALELRNGYMRSEFVPGRAVSVCERDPELFETIAKYVAFRGREFVCDEATPLDELTHATEYNCGWLPPVQARMERPVITDAQMLPRKWIATKRGYLKTDAIDHGDSHFYPGPTDIAWDVAGVLVEFQLNQAESVSFLDRYIHHSGDRGIRYRLPFFRHAYVAHTRAYRAATPGHAWLSPSEEGT